MFTGHLLGCRCALGSATKASRTRSRHSPWGSWVSCHQAWLRAALGVGRSPRWSGRHRVQDKAAGTRWVGGWSPPTEDQYLQAGRGSCPRSGLRPCGFRGSRGGDRTDGGSLKPPQPLRSQNSTEHWDHGSSSGSRSFWAGFSGTSFPGSLEGGRPALPPPAWGSTAAQAQAAAPLGRSRRGCPPHPQPVLAIQTRPVYHSQRTGGCSLAA